MERIKPGKLHLQIIRYHNFLIVLIWITVKTKNNLSTDTETAFLINGDLEEEIFIKELKGIPNLTKFGFQNKILRLHKSIYELIQAARL